MRGVVIAAASTVTHSVLQCRRLVMAVRQLLLLLHPRRQQRRSQHAATWQRHSAAAPLLESDSIVGCGKVLRCRGDRVAQPPAIG